MIVILTGAGISQESGIPTFRDSDGLWENERVEDVATLEGFRRNPQKVYQFYNDRRLALQKDSVVPHAGHFAIARLQELCAEQALLITQNIDNLHERAGSLDVLHMHGELLKGRCELCGNVAVWAKEMSAQSSCPACEQKGGMRPHIVWFSEVPLAMDIIEQALQKCKLFISIGTSGNVYPAAGFAQYAKHAGAHLVELNLEPSRTDDLFDEGHYGPASQVVPCWVDTFIASVQFQQICGLRCE